MIVSGGENVFPREVEDLLADHDAVEEVAVIGVDDEEFGQRLKAFVVTQRAATRSTRTSVKELRQGEPRPLQGPARGRVPRRAAAQRDRQGPQARAGLDGAARVAGAAGGGGGCGSAPVAGSICSRISRLVLLGQLDLGHVAAVGEDHLAGARQRRGDVAGEAGGDRAGRWSPQTNSAGGSSSARRA